MDKIQEENNKFRKLIERAANANIGRPSELIQQFEAFQKDCQEALSQSPPAPASGNEDGKDVCNHPWKYVSVGLDDTYCRKCGDYLF